MVDWQTDLSALADLVSFYQTAANDLMGCASTSSPARCSLTARLCRPLSFWKSRDGLCVLNVSLPLDTIHV